MGSTTIRIREDTQRALLELVSRTGKPRTELIAQAVERYRRDLILADANAAFERSQPDVSAFDATLADGLEGV